MVKRYFTPWNTGQIHVYTGQKVQIKSSILNTVRTRSRKAPRFVKVITECGREGMVPVDVLSISSVCSRPSNRKHASRHLDGVDDFVQYQHLNLLRGLRHARITIVKKQAHKSIPQAAQYRYSCTTVEWYGYRDSRISSCTYNNFRIQIIYE